MFTILGGTGYIGRALTGALKGAGEEVLVPKRGSSEVFERPLGHVIYAIGVTADFRTRPFATVDAHVCHLAEILRRAEFESFLYLSSTRLLSGRHDRGFTVDPEDPSDLYNISKLMGEALCHASNRPNVRVTRLSNVVGGFDPGSDNFVFALLREAAAGGIVLRSNAETRKDYLALDDVVALLPRIAVSGRRSVYDVGSGRQISHREWVERIATATGCSVQYSADGPLFRFEPIDIAPLAEEFGFSPRDPLEALQGSLEAQRHHEAAISKEVQ